MKINGLDFQEAGDVCTNCHKRWLKSGKDPINLLALPTFTMRYHIPLVACPYCDGPLYDVAVANARNRQANDPWS